MNDNELFQNLHYFPLKISIKKLEHKEVLSKSFIKYIETYPKQTWGDLYKFLYQGNCGWIHLIHLSNFRGIKSRLDKELEECVPTRKIEPLFELLSERTLFGRLNLRVWKNESGSDSSLLWKIMQESLAYLPDSNSIFKEQWSVVRKLNDEEVLTTKSNKTKQLAEIITRITNRIASLSKCIELPLISQSTTYRKRYTPLYRIVHKLVLDKFLNE